MMQAELVSLLKGADQPPALTTSATISGAFRSSWRSGRRHRLPSIRQPLPAPQRALGHFPSVRDWWSAPPRPVAS